MPIVQLLCGFLAGWIALLTIKMSLRRIHDRRKAAQWSEIFKDAAVQIYNDRRVPEELKAFVNSLADIGMDRRFACWLGQQLTVNAASGETNLTVSFGKLEADSQRVFIAAVFSYIGTLAYATSCKELQERFELHLVRFFTSSRPQPIEEIGQATTDWVRRHNLQARLQPA